MLSYGEVRSQIRGTSHLLIGNGFSIGCNPVFRYENLFERARSAGLSAPAVKVFEYLGTNNFEGVLRALTDSAQVGTFYGMNTDCAQRMRDDVEVVKTSLVAAIADSHLNHSGEVPAERKAAALDFLKPYTNVFTTNYDLLLYWVIVSASPPPFEDGFRAPANAEEPFVVYTERPRGRPALIYMHGALHLYLAQTELRKYTWSRTQTRLTDQIRAALEEGRYPVFVAEGRPEQKLEQIQRNGYLWYGYQKLSSIEAPLVVYGHSLGASDRHIADAIADAADLEVVYVGVLNGKEESNAKGTASYMQDRRDQLSRRRRGVKRLDVRFFDSSSARVWG